MSVATKAFPPKDVDDLLDESFNFAGMGLAPGETITTAVVTADQNGLTISEPQIQGLKVVVMVDGGLVDTTYTLTCEIQTSNGKRINRKATLLVTDL